MDKDSYLYKGCC